MDLDLELAEDEGAGGGVIVPALAPFGGARGRTEEEAALETLNEAFAARLLGV